MMMREEQKIVRISPGFARSEVGGKGWALGVLTEEFNVPAGFIITSSTFLDFLDFNGSTVLLEDLINEINDENFREIGPKLRQIVISGELPPKTISEIAKMSKTISSQFAAVRSSSISEDGDKASFAGLFDTYLNVRNGKDELVESIKSCWASLFTDRAIIYRYRKGLPQFEGMAVVVQDMIQADVAGITFTRHPLKKGYLLIETAPGLGDSLVSGNENPDFFIIDRKTGQIFDKNVIVQNISEKEENGEKRPRLKADRRVLTEQEITEITKTCMKIEELFASAQDIEWCVLRNQFWILQSRPITETVSNGK